MIVEEYPDGPGSEYHPRDANLDDYDHYGWSTPWSTLRSHRWLLEIDGFDTAGLLARRVRLMR